MYRRGRCRAYDQYKQTEAAPAVGPGSSRIAVPANRSTASAVPAAGSGTARLLVGAGSCTASSLSGAELDPIESKLLRRPRVRATQARRGADVRLVFFIYRAQTSKYCKLYFFFKEKKQNRVVRHCRKSTRDQGPTNRSTYPRLHVWTGGVRR